MKLTFVRRVVVGHLLLYDAMFLLNLAQYFTVRKENRAETLRQKNSLRYHSRIQSYQYTGDQIA